MSGPLVLGLGTILSGLISAAGAISNSRAQASAANYNAAVASQNAQLATQSAAENERRQRVINSKNLGQLRANVGANGITLEGSAADVIEESATAAELEALQIRHEGALQAVGYSNTAKLDRMQAKNAMAGGYLKASGLLLKTGVETYYELNRT